jgi:integrase
VSELIRFTQAGRVEPLPNDADNESAAVLVCPQAKSGEPLRTRVKNNVLDAAKRLLDRGVFTRRNYGVAINAACKAVGVEPFTPGRFRHTVATMAINAGDDPGTVSAFLGHKSLRTTRRFYATHAAPKRVRALI